MGQAGASGESVLCLSMCVRGCMCVCKCCPTYIVDTAQVGDVYCAVQQLTALVSYDDRYETWFMLLLFCTL